jgi:hypothetical protein
MLSRRTWMVRLPTFLRAPGIARVAPAAEPPTKVTQTAARYQDHAKNMQMRGMCKFYIPPGGNAGEACCAGRWDRAGKWVPA